MCGMKKITTKLNLKYTGKRKTKRNKKKNLRTYAFNENIEERKETTHKNVYQVDAKEPNVAEKNSLSHARCSQAIMKSIKKKIFLFIFSSFSFTWFRPNVRTF